MKDKFLWVEQYNPTSVADCILPQSIKDTFKVYAEEKEFPNLILAGPAGTGKTSLLKALCNEIDADHLFVNASLDRGIGDIRTTVAQFASCSSMFGGKKVVILDEADNLTQDSQKALRALIEEFQNHCVFAMTCNYPHNIIESIHSRCSVFDFHVRDSKSLDKLIGEFGMRVVKILKSQKIEFEMKVLAQFIKSKAPDWRGILNDLQGHTKGGALTTDILQDSPDTVVELIKQKKWSGVEEWVFTHSYVNPRSIERGVYESLKKSVKDQYRPVVCILFGQYSHKISLGADPSITILALLSEIMTEVEFK